MEPLAGLSNKRKQASIDEHELEQRREEEIEMNLSRILALQARRRAEDHIEKLILESAITPGLWLAIRDNLETTSNTFAGMGAFERSVSAQVPLRPTELAAGILLVMSSEFGDIVRESLLEKSHEFELEVAQFVGQLQGELGRGYGKRRRITSKQIDRSWDR
jgi:hypothetical protein